MPGRSFSSNGYRFGFNGQEKDDEVKGSGNSVDFGARIYDSRLGRWLTPDPWEYQYSYQSTYASMSNDPIGKIDPDGKGDYYANSGEHLGNDGKSDDKAYVTTKEILKEHTGQDGKINWDMINNNKGTTSITDKFGYKNSQLLQGAAMAYNEGEETFEGRSAIVNVLINRTKLGKTFDQVMSGLAGSGKGETHEAKMSYYLFARYASFFNAGNEGRDADSEMFKCISSAISAMTGGKDYSNGATYWHGFDFFDGKGQPLYLTPKGTLTYESKKVNKKFTDADGNKIYGKCWYAFEQEYSKKGFKWEQNAIFGGKKNSYATRPYERPGDVTHSYGYIGTASYGKNIFMKVK